MVLFVLVISFSCILRAGALPGCSSPCLNGGTCLRSLGECVCVEGWTGAYCQSRETVCPHGYYGVNCLKPCGRCIGNTVCNWVTGNCTSGCEEGSYGWRCEESCGECRGGPACEQATGLCDQGCELTYYGTTCKLRCNCSDARPCDQTTGACSACDEGFYGAVCKRRCGNCRSLAKCNPRSGICETGCHDGYSPPYCKRRISVTPRSPQITTSLPWWKTPQIMIPLGAVYGLLSGIFLCCCLPRMCKRNPLVLSALAAVSFTTESTSSSSFLPATDRFLRCVVSRCSPKSGTREKIEGHRWDTCVIQQHNSTGGIWRLCCRGDDYARRET
ncbi:protein draper-like [Pomacea canaliculata]|uniref:protein draper-like n=1 Tax=Pomacea canaliculata TaxID=400727 RepID=UPI000D73337D|nr:protein draper-like [Pomacea canaliculata]